MDEEMEMPKPTRVSLEEARRMCHEGAVRLTHYCAEARREGEAVWKFFPTWMIHWRPERELLEEEQYALATKA